MLAKWAEDDRQANIKAEQHRQKMLEFRHLCQQLDVQRHKQLIADRVFVFLSHCLRLFTSVKLTYLLTY